MGIWDYQRKCRNAKKRGTGPFALLVSLASKAAPMPLQPLSTLYHRSLPGINGPWERLFLKLYLRVKKHKKDKHTQTQKGEDKKLTLNFTPSQALWQTGDF